MRDRSTLGDTVDCNNSSNISVVSTPIEVASPAMWCTEYINKLLDHAKRAQKDLVKSKGAHIKDSINGRQLAVVFVCIDNVDVSTLCDSGSTCCTAVPTIVKTLRDRNTWWRAMSAPIERWTR